MAGKDALRHVTLLEFLNSANAGVGEVPSPVHTTKAINVLDIAREGKLVAEACPVFNKEKLNYLFIGRPSYKWDEPGDCPHWMCPVVFVFRGLDKMPIRRIYPFDTGAYAGERLPSYINAFTLDGFCVGNEPAEVSRLISSFYDNKDRFLRGDARPLESIKSEVQFGIRHARIEALVKLYGERSSATFDDRVRNIEVQVAGDIDLSGGNLLGVVLPDSYKLEQDLTTAFAGLGAQVSYYPLFPLNAGAHFGMLYERVMQLLG